MKRLLSYLKPYRLQSILAPLFKCLEAVMELLVPLIMASVIDVGIPAGDTSYVLSRGALLVGLGLLGLLFSVTAQYFASFAAAGFGAGLRTALVKHIDGFSFRTLDRFGTATLTTRLTTDVQRVQDGVNLFLRLFLRSPFLVIGALVMCFTVDRSIALICLLSVPFLGLAIYLITAYGLPRLTEAQKRLDRLARLTRENRLGVRVVRAFAKEEDAVREFDAAGDELTSLQLSNGRVAALLNPLTYVMVNLVIIVIIRQGGRRVDSGLLTQGAVVALVNYMTQILTEMLRVADLTVSLTKALASAGRLRGVFETESDMPEGSVRHAEERGTVRFEAVSAAYHDDAEPVLCDISFEIEAGSRVGIIGGTGEGKTTLVSLIPRFYDAKSGRVLVDGVDVRDFSLKALRSRIGIALQEPFLFRGTLRENLRLAAPEADDGALLEALRRAQALDFVQEKGGLDTEVEQGGANFSGGQRARLCIARALAARPEILILDDSFAALDALTDRLLRRSLAELAGVTVITVSQRVPTVRSCDRILVLEDGRLVGNGTHDALFADCAVYRSICESQSVGGAHE